MQALSMIDTSSNPLETVSPSKSPEPQGKQFGKVLNEQRQSEQARQKPEAAETQDVKQAESQKNKQVATSGEKTAEQSKVEQQAAEKPAEGSVEVVAEAKPKLQKTVVALLKVIAGGETPELVEAFGSSEELLSQLVQQLDGAELEGEQVLAGIDLSALVEQLQALNEGGGEEPFAQLVEQLGLQLEEQLADDEGLQANAELVAALMPGTDPQVIAPKMVENLGQARQILQKAINEVAPQQVAAETEPQVVEETEASGEELLFAEEAAEEIDPRFASLLKPRTGTRQQQQSLRQQMQGAASNANSAQAKVGETASVIGGVASEQSEGVDFSELLGSQPKQGLENLAQQAQAHANLAQPHNAAAKVMPQTPTIQLPSGQQVAESQIFDQVVTRFVGSANGESGRMVLRLQPAELGSLKIELQIEGDRIRANLHAQTQQVQEVLERNLPQLRNALAEQGLKIDQFQVDVNKDQSQQQQFEQMAQQQQRQQSQQQKQDWQQSWDTEEQIVPLAHLMQNGGGGLSLHV